MKNPFAKSLASGLFAKRVVVARKGKGSYSRKGSNRRGR